MPVTRVSLLFTINTSPQDRSTADPHAGGWSEGFWANALVPSNARGIRDLATARAQLLPEGASIIGARLAVYNISGNKLFPVGTSTVRFRFPGTSNELTDLPQVSVQMSGATAGGANANRFTVRCVPDIVMARGEYQPDASFKGRMTRFCNEVANGGWGFIGRDLSLPVQRVLSVNGTIVKLSGLIGAVAGSSFMRLIRVYDNDGLPITGSHLITAINPTTFEYTLPSLGTQVGGASGRARVDSLVYNDYTAVAPVRAVARKIGRPFESYRGRASRR